MDYARHVAAGKHLVRGEPFSKRPMVAALMVCDWSRRRFDSDSRLAPKSHTCADDLLATAASGRRSSHDIVCDILLPRQCRCFFEPGLAIDCWSSYPRFYQRISSVDACDLDKPFCPNRGCGARKYVTDGSVSRAVIVDCNLPAIWTNARTKAARHREKRSFGGGACNYFRADRICSG